MPPRLLLFVIVALVPSASLQGQERPNIVWIISEDNGPQLGCYGDDYAETPHIDAFAAEGIRYDLCWSNSPVCAPARTTLFSGLYASSTGSEHMRSLVPLPRDFQFFPTYLREAGYFTANARKTDWNLSATGKPFDLSGNKVARAWRNVAEGQPFFVAFNLGISHESQIRSRPHELVHDPAKAPIPPYHPDTPEVRHDWAQYYDKLTAMDAEVGRILAQLEEDGHAEDTIVFYFGDHGSGMPRSKRWLYDGGLRVPLVIRIPEKYRALRPADYRAGGVTQRLVSFVDFAPTVLNLAGIQPPKHFQGRAFLGEQSREPSPYLYGLRGRMDERVDLSRAVTDGRYLYVRNFMPHRIYGQHLGYMFQTPTTRVWKELHDAGKLNEVQAAFWEEKPSEELYDRTADPFQVHNLAESPEYEDEVRRLRGALREWMARVRDVGLLPESLMHAECRESGLSPYELGHDIKRYPLETVLQIAELASSRTADSTQELMRLRDAPHTAVRYWVLTGLLVRGEAGFKGAGEEYVAANMRAETPILRIVACELAGRYGDDALAEEAVARLIADGNFQDTDEYAAANALLVLDELLTARPEIVKRHAREILAIPATEGEQVNARARDYPRRLQTRLAERLGEGSVDAGDSQRK